MTMQDDADDHVLDDMLVALTPEVAPPDALRTATKRRLEESGLLQRRRPVSRFGRVAALAAMVTFAFMVGRISAEPANGGAAPIAHLPEPSWALLLYGTPDADTVSSAVDMVALYRAWATDERDAGRLTLAEKLGDEGAVLHADRVEDVPSEGLGVPGGMFIVQAKDLAAAMELAKGMPHHRLGGTVLVQRIEAT
jgi:hypothetical protein